MLTAIKKKKYISSFSKYFQRTFSLSCKNNITLLTFVLYFYQRIICTCYTYWTEQSLQLSSVIHGTILEEEDESRFWNRMLLLLLQCHIFYFHQNQSA